MRINNLLLGKYVYYTAIVRIPNFSTKYVYGKTKSAS